MVTCVLTCLFACDATVTLFVFAAAKQVQTYLYMTVKQHAYQDVAAKVRSRQIDHFSLTLITERH